METTISASEHKREIARINGAKSRGPVTAEGKLRSSQNAFKHGLLCEDFRMSSECPEKFAELSRNIGADLNPQTETERILARTFGMCSLRLNRVWDLEAAALQTELLKIGQQDEACTGPAASLEAWRRLHASDPSFPVLRRYEATFARQMFRALKELRELRKAEPVPPQIPVLRNEPTEELTPTPSTPDASQTASPSTNVSVPVEVPIDFQEIDDISSAVSWENARNPAFPAPDPAVNPEPIVKQ